MRKACYVFFLTLLFLDLKAQEKPSLILDPQGHSSVIFDIEVLNDRKTIVSGSWDKTIRFWDSETGNLEKTIRLWHGSGSIGQVVGLSVSPNGKYLAVSILAANDIEGSVRIIDIEENRVVARLVGHKGTIIDLIYSNDGDYIIGSSAGSNSIYFWKVEEFDSNQVTTVKLLRSIDNAHNKEIYSIGISPDRTKLVSASHDSTAKLWTLPYNLEEDNIDKDNRLILGKHNDIVRCCAISPDGRYIATGSSDRSLSLWDMNGNLVKQLQNSGKIATVKFSPDSKKLAAFNAGESELDMGAAPYIGTVYSCPDGKIISTFSKHKDAIMSACFIDNNWIATGSWNISDIYVWNTENRAVKCHIQGKGHSYRGIGWGKDFKIAYGFENTDKFTETTLTNYFDFVDFQTGSVENEFEYKQANWEHNGRRLYSSPSNVINGEFVNDSLAGMYTYSFLNDGSVLVASAYFYNVVHYTKNLKKNKLFQGHETNIWAIATSPDQKYMVSAGVDQTIKLWSLADSGCYPTFLEVFNHKDWSEFCKSNNLLHEANSRNISDWNIIINAVEQSNRATLANRMREYVKQVLPVVKPLVSLFIGSDNEWICWTPNGYFNCSPKGDKYFGWHVNNGYDSLAHFYPASQLFEKYYRPDIVNEVIRTGITDSIILKKFDATALTITQNLKKVPVIKILSPSKETSQRGFKGVKKDVFSTELEKVEIEIEVTEGLDNLSEIRLYQNEKLLERLKDKAIGKNVTFDASLLQGENRFNVIAISKQRTESVPTSITIQRIGGANISNIYILSIGINEYKNSNYNLNYAVRDAETIAASIMEGSKSIFSKQYSHTILNSNAQKSNIIKTLHDIKDKANKEDVFILYYAGHGIMSEQTHDQQSDFYLVTHDITQVSNSSQLQEKGISASELLNLLIEIKAQKQLLILDACQSGGAVEKMATRGLAEEKAITQLARSAGFHLIASSGTEQYASETEKLGHGIFTYSLLEGLMGKAESASNDGKITVLELSSYLNDRVPDLTKEYKGQTQYPKIFIKGDDFPIVLLDKLNRRDK